MTNKISCVEIKDFLVFKGEFRADFSPGINVLIGENGSGKTTLMKVLYRLCGNSKNYHTEEFFFAVGRWNGEFSNRPFEHLRMQMDTGKEVSRICVKSLRCSGLGEEEGGGDRILDDQKWELYYPDVYKDNFTETHAVINGDCQDELVFSTDNYSVTPSIFIPIADMLSHANGLLEMIDAYEMDFDATQVDILRNAQRPALREMKANLSKVLDKIGIMIGGEVMLDKGRFFLKKNDGQKVEFSIEASGLARLGLLWKLLRNGLLEPGSILFWDEPEASINPWLIPSLVDILLELQRCDVQIFVATHSYDIARWFELNHTTGDQLRYFNMRKEECGVAFDVADDYLSLPSSIIEDAGDKLLQRVTETAAESAGVILK